MSAERRKHKRVQASFPCAFVGADKGQEPFELIDLSESGARLRCARALIPMTEIQVALKLPGPRVGQKQDVAFQTRGVVVWSHRGGSAGASAAAAKAPGKAVSAKAAAGPKTAASPKASAEGFDTGVFFPEVTRDQRALLLAYVMSVTV